MARAGGDAGGARTSGLRVEGQHGACRWGLQGAAQHLMEPMQALGFGGIGGGVLVRSVRAERAPHIGRRIRRVLHVSAPLPMRTEQLCLYSCACLVTAWRRNSIVCLRSPLGWSCGLSARAIVYAAVELKVALARKAANADRTPAG